MIMINKLKLTITVLLSILLINSCYKKKDYITTLQTDSSSNKAYLKFINVYTALTPSAAAIPSGPSVNIFINNVKINGGAVSYGGLFPVSPAYAAVIAAPNTNIKMILNRPTGPAVAGDTLINKNYDLAANTYTTVFVTDTFPNPVPQNSLFLPFPETVDNVRVGFFRARFFNMIPSPDTLEVFSKRLNAVIFKGTLYKNGSELIELPTFIISDTLQLRRVSVPATILASINGFFPTSSRIYTVYGIGLITATTGSRARTLTSFTNR